MPFVHGKNLSIIVWDSAGTCLNISGDKNNVTMSWQRNNPETTTFGKIATQRIAGLQDLKLSGAGIWNSNSASGIDAVFSTLMYTTAAFLVRLEPAGNGNPNKYSVYAQMNKYEVMGAVNGVVAASWEADLSQDSIVNVSSFVIGYSPIGMDPIG